MELEIAPAIPAWNEWKILINNSATYWLTFKSKSCYYHKHISERWSSTWRWKLKEAYQNLMSCFNRLISGHKYTRYSVTKTILLNSVYLFAFILLCIYLLRKCTWYLVIVSKYMSNALVMYNIIFEESLFLYLIIVSVLVRKSHIDVLAPINPAIHQNGIILSLDLVMETWIMYIIFYT